MTGNLITNRKKIILFQRCFIVLIFLILTGCSAKDIEKELVKNNTYYELEIDDLKNLQEETKNLKKEIKELKEQINKLENNKLDPKSLTYINYNYKSRLVKAEQKFYIYPGENSPLVGNVIKAGTYLEVLDAGILEDDKREVWLYVKIPVYDTPMDCKGWIKEEYTVLYNNESKEEVVNGILILKGVHIYAEYEDIKENNFNILDTDKIGMINNVIDDYANVAVAGGETFWIRKSDITYPDIS